MVFKYFLCKKYHSTEHLIVLFGKLQVYYIYTDFRYKINLFLVYSLHNVKAIENILDASLSTEDKLNYGPNKHKLAVNFVLRILKQGLGNKISAICALPRKVKEWEINTEIPNDLERFYIGLQFDPDTSYSIIEKGPGANLAEV